MSNKKVNVRVQNKKKARRAAFDKKRNILHNNVPKSISFHARAHGVNNVQALLGR